MTPEINSQSGDPPSGGGARARELVRTLLTDRGLCGWARVTLRTRGALQRGDQGAGGAPGVGAPHAAGSAPALAAARRRGRKGKEAASARPDRAARRLSRWFTTALRRTLRASPRGAPRTSAVCLFLRFSFCRDSPEVLSPLRVVLPYFRVSRSGRPRSAWKAVFPSFRAALLRRCVYFSVLQNSVTLTRGHAKQIGVYPVFIHVSSVAAVWETGRKSHDGRVRGVVGVVAPYG